MIQGGPIPYLTEHTYKNRCAMQPNDKLGFFGSEGREKKVLMWSTLLNQTISFAWLYLEQHNL